MPYGNAERPYPTNIAFMPSLQGVWENVIAGLVMLAIVAAATWLASSFDAPIVFWAVVLISTVALVIGIGLGRIGRSGEDLHAYKADLICTVGGGKIRLSVLEFENSSQTFQMIYQSGYSQGRKNNFSPPKASLAGYALESRELQWTNNVDDDKR